MIFYAYISTIVDAVNVNQLIVAICLYLSKFLVLFSYFSVIPETTRYLEIISDYLNT